MRTCSIIIPVFNKVSLTRQCLDALLAEHHPELALEIIVVDDASTDSTPEELADYKQKVGVVRHEVNAGFATSCNDGAEQASGELLVFLNNDTIPHAGWLEALVHYADQHPEAAVVGSKLLYPNGTIQHAGVVICQDRYARHLYAGLPGDHPAVNKSRRFQVVTAACVLVRPELFRHAKGFDPAFQNGLEDVDLCLRLGEQGHQVHYCHTSVLTHLESVTRTTSKEERANNQLYMERWGHRVQPDDFRYYLEDGLIRMTYDQVLCPLALKVSPLLALIDEEGRQREADRLLRARGDQVFGFLKDTIRLGVELKEARARADFLSRSAPFAVPAVAPLPPEPQLVSQGQVRWLSSEADESLVSIILPVKNGAAKLQELLPMVMRQRSRHRIEVVAVDSGSRDNSLEVLRELGATVIAIDPSTFNHGLTRNLGARHAKGDVLVFLNQGAMPADEHWLANLLAPLKADPQVVGVCSRTQPRPEADLLTRRDVLRDEDSSPERQVRQVADRDAFRKLSPHERRLAINFHTISAAIRADVFRRFPFQKVSIGEDILWAKEVLEAGLKVQHEPTSVVYHSHDYTFSELMQRHFDDGWANRQIVGRQFPIKDLVPRIFARVRDDWRYLAEECQLAPEELQQWQITAVLRRAAQALGEWLGVNHERFPVNLVPLLSLTERIKAGHATERPAGGAT
jgi:GT2 family glycosyltransferase